MGISIWQLLIVLVIVLLIFGAKKLRTLGGDLGSAVKNFREAVKEPDGKGEAAKESPPEKLTDGEGRVIEGEASRDKDKV